MNPSVEAIYYTPPSEGVAECVGIEVVGGPKPFARYFPISPSRIEWGHTLHDTATEVYRRENA